MRGFWPTILWVAVVAGLSAQAPAPTAPAPQAPAQEQPTFRVQVEAVTQDVVVKDDRGLFVPDLTRDDFEIYEDGVKQDIVSMTMVSGGRVTNLLEAPAAVAPEGVILPPIKRVNDTSGRIFLFFVDDLHLQFANSGRVRELFKKVAKELVHEGDLFGIVSSGPSSIAIDMTYDRKRLDEAISKMTGDGLKPSDVINSGSGAQGPPEIRYRAQVAFKTMDEALRNLERVHDRRKALVWVSEGYDFIPFQASRLGLMDPRTGTLQNDSATILNQLRGEQDDTGSNFNPANSPEAMRDRQSETFADADLVMELAEITRTANRSNVTIYTIDPRGLVAGSDIDQPVDTSQWNQFVTKTQNSLRVIAEETGGIAVVNQNDFDRALKRIDADTSDYYVLGYYSNNLDVTRRRRQIEVRVLRDGLNVTAARKEYSLRPPPRDPEPAPAPASAPATR
jgi:VWFA-related protein